MRFFFHFGRYVQFIGTMFSKPERAGVYVTQTFREMNSLGVGSLAIVVLTSVFMGAVTTVQTAYQLFGAYIAKSVIGSVVSDSMMLELAPTIVGLVLAGKVGSNIASEIGTMRVSEQIDALEVMGINSKGYLVAPKIIAGIIMIPLLIAIAMFVGILGGLLAGQISGILPQEAFIEGARDTFKPFTLYFGLIKAATFAFIITSVSAYQGYFTKGGALEVGESSTRAVVYSAVLILFSDYLLAELLL